MEALAILQALDKLAITVDGDLVNFLAEPVSSLLAIGLPGGPTPLPREQHNGKHCISHEAAYRLTTRYGKLQAPVRVSIALIPAGMELLRLF